MLMKFKRIIKKLLPDPVIQKYRTFQVRRNLPERARKAERQDFVGVPAFDPGPEVAILANLSWISRAQDCSATADGGVSRHFSLVNGWGPSYPETTGYIIPTMLAEAKIRDDSALRKRAERMLDWLVAIQLPEGAFQAGVVTRKPVVPVTFNTGQILLGLAAGARVSHKENYLFAMHRAATWLVETQDADGCWRRFPAPSTKPGEKAYETHVSWGLFEAERVSPGKGYGEAGLKQVHWALTKQQDNSWIRDCCLNDPIRPLTHTIGYALRGVLEAYRFSQNEIFLDAGVRTADALIHCVKSDGFLAGRFNSHWRPVVDWVCLTGSVQIAYCWLLLFDWTGDTRYFDAGRKVNSYVRRTIAVKGDPDLVGGVRGSFPISGTYGNYEYLNWAAKFCIDSLRKEVELTEQGAGSFQD
jgi:hypothetical protein